MHLSDSIGAPQQASMREPRPQRGRLLRKIIAVMGFAALSAIGLLPRTAAAATLLPCDIYAKAGTPCVAAHSTTRALFAGYTGSLYQVTRASDQTTLDIGLLAPGGYANAAAQDNFCINTTCIITRIYDQTSRHNDLTIEAAECGLQQRRDLLRGAGQQRLGLVVPVGELPDQVHSPL